MIQPLPKAILFDLDDTILASSDAAEEAWCELSDRFTHRLPGYSAESLRIAIADSRSWFRNDPARLPEGADEGREIAARAFATLAVDDNELVQEFSDSYGTLKVDITKPIPGAMRTLYALEGMGIGLGLITGGDGPTQRRKVEHHKLDPIFDTVLIEGELGYGKPEERVYREALDFLGVQPSETWMVGDGLEWDLATAQQLGMVGVWVVWPASKYKVLNLPPSAFPENSKVQPDHIVRRISEILE